MSESFVESGDRVVYLLAYGQYYDAKVKEIYADQAHEGGGPTIDLEYGGAVPTPAWHVPYNAALQQPHTWCRYRDPGKPGTLTEPRPAEEVSE
jgi:hypothetical protein